MRATVGFIAVENNALIEVSAARCAKPDVRSEAPDGRNYPNIAIVCRPLRTGWPSEFQSVIR